MNARFARVGPVSLIALTAVVFSASGIVSFPAPVPGGRTTMFRFIRGSHGLYGGWVGPPGLTIETPLGTITGCTVHVYSRYVYVTGQVAGGQIIFSDTSQKGVFPLTFTNGWVDTAGLRCGPKPAAVCNSASPPAV